MSQSAETVGPAASDLLTWPLLVRKLAIWGGFFALLYVTRDFFFTGFMTFMFSYLTLAIVGWGMRMLSPGRDRRWLRRLLTMGVFAVGLCGLGLAVSLVAPHVLAQGQRLVGWLSHVNFETETARLLDGFIGPYLLRQKYPSDASDQYKKDLEQFRRSPDRRAAEYQDFARIQAWLEGGFSRQFTEERRSRIKREVLREGALGKDFEDWFTREKYAALRDTAQKPSKVEPDALAAQAAAMKPDELLRAIRQEPEVLNQLRDEWVRVTLHRRIAAELASPVYEQEFREYFDQQRKSNPALTPYTFDVYMALREARPRGVAAFGETFERHMASAESGVEAKLKAAFEAARGHELFEAWWADSAPARLIQHQFEAGLGDAGGIAARAESAVSTLLDVPLSLLTALLLSFFICIDFATLRRGVGRLRDTWMRSVYDEIVPALSRVGQLIGLSMKAQGLIALCNATMIFIALTLLGVEHHVLLALLVFVLCLVPTLGAMIAWAIISAFALLQPGGGPLLAVKVSGAFVVVGFMESFVLSPRILGRMMELHPVLIIALLPVMQYFFGVWGLILATPLAVYVIHVVILGRDVGQSAAHAAGGGPAE